MKSDGGSLGNVSFLLKETTGWVVFLFLWILGSRCEAGTDCYNLLTPKGEANTYPGGVKRTWILDDIFELLTPPAWGT